MGYPVKKMLFFINIEENKACNNFIEFGLLLSKSLINKKKITQSYLYLSDLYLLCYSMFFEFMKRSKMHVEKSY